MPLATLAALQREAIYGSNWLTNNLVDSCAAFQSLYEAEACCSGALSSELVVFRRPVAACELGWRAATLGGLTQCVRLHPTAAWSKAEAAAACAGENATLVEPRTPADDATIQALLGELDAAAVAWDYFWIGATQHANATDAGAEWTWDSDGAALADAGRAEWASGQPTTYDAGAERDGPEDCALYRKGDGWHDAACSPAAAVACMVPSFAGACWGANPADGFAHAPGVTSGTRALCLKLLGGAAHSPAAARAACAERNAQLYYPATRAESDAFAAWVYAQTAADARVWLNVAQDKAAAAAAGADPAAGWTLPDGTRFGQSDGSAIPWNAPSDPEGPAEPAGPSQDALALLVTGSDAALQPALPPPPGAPPPPPPPFYQMAAGYGQIGQTLPGERAKARSGHTVATSADGTTVAVGAYQDDGPDGDNKGLVRVWAWNGYTSAWDPMGQLLYGNDKDENGYGLVLTADGTMLAMSGYNSHAEVRKWNPETQQWDLRGNRLTEESGTQDDGFGNAVALSDDGTVLAVACRNAQIPIGTSLGEVRVYDLSGNTWDRRPDTGNKLRGTEVNKYAGQRIAMSGSGNILAMSSHYATNDAGLVYAGEVRVVEWNGDSWDQQSAVPHDDIGGEAEWDLSQYIALSKDGKTLAIGAPRNDGVDSPINTNRGHVRVYAYDGDHWRQRGGDLDGENTGDQFGASVALSADGNVLAAGSANNRGEDDEVDAAWRGHTRVFAWTGTTYEQVGGDIDGERYDNSGVSVALSSDGHVLVVGAWQYQNGSPDDKAGLARVYALQSNARALVGNPYFTSATAIETNADWPDGAGNWGIAHSSNHNGEGWNAFRHPITGANQWGWTSGSTTNDEWVTFTYPEPVLLQRYVLTGRDNDQFYPKEWVMEGSNDGGTTWTAIGTTQTPDSPWATRQVTEVDVSFNTVEYSSFRVFCPYVDTTLRSIGYIRLFTAAPPSAPAPPAPPLVASPPPFHLTAAGYAPMGQEIVGENGGGYSGHSVALSADGTVAAIGEYQPSANSERGKVRVFEYDAANDHWNQRLPDLEATDTRQRCGTSVALNSDGTVVAVGCTRSSLTVAEAGHAQLWKWDGANSQYVRMGQDLPGDSLDESMGISVALSADGQILAVGAYKHSSFKGRVRTFTYDATNDHWDPRGTIPGEVNGDFAGVSVDLSADGTVLAIGAHKHHGPGMTDSGDVRVFDWVGGTWQLLRPALNAEHSNDRAGASVALSADGSIVAIGAPENDGADHPTDTKRGHVRVWKWEGGAWVPRGQDGELDGVGEGDESGMSVALSADGSILAIGAPKHNGGEDDEDGQTRVFSWGGTAWQLVFELDGNGAGDMAGYSVALSADGGVLSVGTRLFDYTVGSTNVGDAGKMTVYAAQFHPSPPFPPSAPPPPPPLALAHGKWQDVPRMADGAGALCVRPSPLPQPPPPPPP